MINRIADYHNPRSALLGLVSAMYSLGAIIALPFVPPVVDKIGRRCSILIESILMIIGGVLQGAALNRKRSTVFRIPELISPGILSYDVHHRSLFPGLGDCLCHRSRLFFDWRFVVVPLTWYLLDMKLYKELSHPKERAIMGALFDCCYSIGKLKL